MKLTELHERIRALGIEAQTAAGQHAGQNDAALWDAGAALIRLADGKPEFNGVALRKLESLKAQGWRVNGVCIQHTEADGSHHYGAVTSGGMVLWWHGKLGSTRDAQKEPIGACATCGALQDEQIVQRAIDRLDVATAIQTLCANGYLPDSMEVLADWVAKGEMPKQKTTPLTAAEEAAHGITGEAQ